MATKQYRWSGLAYWHSQSGNAIIAIQNNSGSNKRVIINSFNIDTASVGASTGYTELSLVIGTSLGGTSIPLTAMDTEATVPSGISVNIDSSTTVTSTLIRTFWYKNLNQGSSAIAQRWGAKKFCQYFSSITNDSTLEPFIIRTGESISLTVISQTCSQILRVSGTIVVQGTPSRTFMFSKDVPTKGIGSDLISFINTSASDVFEVRKLYIEEVGTFDTPYLQLVPIGSINAESLSDTSKYLTPCPMDTAYGALDTALVKLITDAPLQPFGVPFSYISASSTATPKGYNYLHTKDYVGPSYFNVFPEYNRYSSAGLATDGRLLGLSNKNTNIISNGAPIVLHPGEALGLVSAAETAVVATAIGASGWGIIELGITFTIAPVVDPTLTITGLVSGCDIVILEAGTSTELLNVDSHGSTSYDWDYDPDVVSSVDICIYKAGYIPYIIRNYSPGALGASIPIAQTIDRAYI